MPDLIRIADLSHGEQDALDELVAQWRAKRRRNNLRSAFYDMKNSERHLMAQAVPDVVRRRRFVLGWSSIAVDKLNRRCNLEGFYDAAGNDLDALGLAEIVRDNRLLSEVSQAGVSSLIHAVSWLVTTQGDTEAGEPEVLINARDASTATGVWDVRRRELRSFLSLTDFDDNGEPVGMVMYLPGLNVHMAKVGRWRVERREHDYGVPVDPLRYKPRLGRPFGSSRLNRTVMSLHEQAIGGQPDQPGDWQAGGQGHEATQGIARIVVVVAMHQEDGQPGGGAPRGGRPSRGARGRGEGAGRAW